MTRRRYRSGMRWCAWRWTDVVLDGELYLRRLHLVQTPWFSIMLHWIPRPDPQPHLHDHPVSFLSILLRGSYLEERPAGTLKWRGRFAFVRCTESHRIRETEGSVVTLVFAGPVRREWGFHTERGWVSWREYGA